MDPIETNTKFAQELGLTYPLLSDPTKATAAAYGVLEEGYATRWTFIIGKDGKVLDVLRNVSPKTHGKDIAARLAELGVPKKAGASTPETPKSLLRLDATGCFAWSKTELTVACIEGASSIANGCKESLVLVGGKDPTARHAIVDVPPQCLGEQKPALAPDVKAKIEARLAASFAPLPEPTAKIEAGKKAEVLGTELELAQTKTGHKSIPNAGAWDVYRHETKWKCKKKSQTIFKTTIENPDSATVSAVDTGNGWIAVWYQAHYGIEGDIGSRIEVALLDPATCTVRKP